MFVAYWMVVSLALVGWPRLVYSIATIRYSGPIAWLGRHLGFAQLKPGARGALFLLLMVILGGTYLAVIYLVRKENRRVFTWILLGGFAAFTLLFIFVPAYRSRDIFSYTFYGRTISVYHKNPYILIPQSRPLDIYFPMIGWRHSASVYGPVFNLAAAIITRIAGSKIVLDVFLFKLMAFLFYAGTVGIVFSLTKKVSPGRQNMALAITAWSPLLMMHVIGAGHNDAMLIFFIMLGFLLYRKDYKLLAIAVMGVAFAVKITAILALAPMFILYMRDRRESFFKRFAKGAAVAIAVPAVLYAPFWAGPKIFDTTRQMAKAYSGSSVPTLFRNVFSQLLGSMGITSARALNLATAGIWLALTGLFVVVTIVLLYRVRDYRSMMTAAAAISLVWFLTTPYILPWYLTIPLIITAVTGWNVTTGSALAASSVFLMYNIPNRASATRPLRFPLRAASSGNASRPSSVLFMGISFTVILVVWLVAQTRVWRYIGNRLSGGSGSGGGAECA
jgi:alpha-1,6-mannosyltransferase